MTAPFLQADLSAGNGRIYKVVFEGLCAFDNSSGRQVKVRQPFAQLLQKAKSLLRSDGKIVFLSCASDEVTEVQKICTEMGLRCERAKERKMVGSNPYIKLTAR
jgi:23S rRNA G2069 N7-methylase RlmK/C1962 C5-methylase RlmI